MSAPSADMICGSPCSRRASPAPTVIRSHASRDYTRYVSLGASRSHFTYEGESRFYGLRVLVKVWGAHHWRIRPRMRTGFFSADFTQSGRS